MRTDETSEKSQIRRPLRVLVIEPAGNLWGSERVLLDILAAPEGVHYAVCCPPDGPLSPELTKIGIPVFPTFVANTHEKSRWFRLKALLGFLLSLRAFRADVVYLNQAGCYRIASLGSRLYGVPIVAHVRTQEDGLYLARCRPTAKHLKGVIAISNWVAGELRGHRSLSEIFIHMIYDGYRRKSIDNSPGPPDQDNRPPTLACVGRVEKIKGHDILVAALNRLNKKSFDFHCYIIGAGGAFYRALIERARSLGLQPKVEWLGFVSDPQSILRHTRVLLVPSHREPLGRVIFEAWDAGCVPVVFQGSGGAAEIIQDSGGGILYSRQESDCLAGAIQEAASLNSEDHAALVAKGRAWMTKHTDADLYAAAMRDIFVRAAHA